MGEPLSCRKLVVVEGKDEVNVYSALKAHLGLVDIEIRSFEGVNSLREYLKALTQVSGFDQVVSLGIIRDAERSRQEALQSIRDSLASVGLPFPASCLEPAEGMPRVIVLVNPHGRETGSLDDVCLDAVGSHPALECVERYIQCLGERDLTPGNQAKARVHAFISSKQRPEVSLGVAVKRGYFPLDHRAFAPARQLLQML